MHSRNRALNARAIGAIAISIAALVVGGAGILVLNGLAGRTLSGEVNAYQVTYLATAVVQPTETPAAPSISAAPPTEAPPASATPRSAQYVVRENDTLWDIALAYGFANPDPILAANPGLNPDLLALGQVLIIPGLDFIPPAAVPGDTAILPPAAAANDSSGENGRVKADAGGLRLRDSPVVGDNVRTRLTELTPLRILGRTNDNLWLQVVTPTGTQGWVMAQYVESSNSTAIASILPIVATAEPAGAGPPPVENPPYLSDVSARALEVYAAGQARGNRANAFALIGDSNTENPNFFRAFDAGGYDLGARYAYLEATIQFFRGSFNRVSPAARGGFGTLKALDPAHADPAQCAGGETPVACELRITRPSVALVLIGTGDQHSWQGYEGRLRQIVEQTIANGTIPILITKGDDLEHRDNSAPSGYINSVIRRVAGEYQMPLLNLSQVLDGLPARGFGPDGFHYNWPPDERCAVLTGDHLLYGFNQRNLTALQALDLVRRRVIQP